MMLKKWEKLPPEMQTEEVRKYYDILKKRKVSLFFKRVFDIVVSSIMLIILSPMFLILAIAIKIDSKGPVFYRQVRVTQYDKKFRIFKFRTMCQGADKGSQVTVNGDDRVTQCRKIYQRSRLDEISQLLDVWRGRMSVCRDKTRSSEICCAVYARNDGNSFIALGGNESCEYLL